MNNEITKEDFIAWLQKQPLSTKIDILTPALVNENSTYKDLHIVTTKITDSLRKQVHTSQSDTLKPRFDSTMMFDALSYQLENKAIPVEVFQYVQDLHNKDDEWMKVAKHTKLKDTERSSVARQVIKCEFPVVGIVEDKGMSVKEAINNGKTPTQQIRTISKYISLSDRVDMLENKVKEIDLRQVITECRLDSLEYQISNPQKQIAIKLKLEGRTNKDIAKTLGVNVKTVGRWLKKDNK